MSFPASILRLTGLELFKLRRQRLTLAVTGVPALTATLLPLALRLSGSEATEGYRVLAGTLEPSLLLGALLILLQGAICISWETGEKTLRESLVSPVRRSEILLSRWLALVVEILVLTSLVALLALLSTGMQCSFGDIRGEAIEPLFYAWEVRHHLVLGLVSWIPACVTLVTLGMLVSVLCSSPAVAMALSLGSLIVLDTIKSLFSSLSDTGAFLFNSYLPTLFDQTSYLHGVTALSTGVGDVLWLDGSPRYHLQFVVPALSTACCLGVALVIFSRKDFSE